jgi:predicted dehydrogenase
VVSIDVALVGLGRMGSVHLEAIRAIVPRLRLVAVAEPRAEPATPERSGDAAVYADARQALRHPGVTACIVATPTDSHRSIVAQALEAGVHVFCEKPLTLAPHESLELEAMAEARGLVLQIGFWRRFAEPLVEARRLLHAGAIGRPLLLRLVQWDVDCPPADWCDPARSGGIFVDMAIHEFDEIEWLLDEAIAEVTARPLALVNEDLAAVGDYDNAVVLARLAGGAHAMIEVSRNGRYADDIRLEILGNEGAILVETVPHGRVRLGTRAGLQTVWEQDGDVFLTAIAAQLEAFAALVSREPLAPDVPGAAASIRAVAIGEAARESAAGDLAVAVR